MLGIIGLGGKCSDEPSLRRMIPQCYYAVAADSGMAHFKKLGIVPDLLVGDLDSISDSLLEQAKKEHVAIEQYDCRKNRTDSEIAVEKALSHGCGALLFLGAFGNRLDHMLSNQMMAVSLASRGIPVILTDGVTFFHTITAENSPFAYSTDGLRDNEDVLSIVPMLGETVVITLQGFEYPLDRETILFGSTRTVSNTVPPAKNRLSDHVTVSIDSGVVFFIRTKSDEFLIQDKMVESD